VAQSGELRAAIASLEQQYDWTRGGQTPKSGAEGVESTARPENAAEATADTDELPVGGDMFADLDRFLREQREPPAGSR
jgi:hypothetical protein